MHYLKLKSKIGIIGANARAVTDSAARAGYEAYLIDYFSDLDTSKSANHVFSMQKTTLNPNFRGEYSREKLTDFAIEKLKGKVNNVLLASSIGSDYRMIEKLETHFKILGNNSRRVKKARNWKFLMKIFDKFKIRYPETLIFDSFDSIGCPFGFPFVIKPSVEKEFQMKLINNKQELRNFLDETKEKFKINNKKLHGKILVQEFIEGIPVSSSVLGNGKEAVTISINKQLIGIRELNAMSRFTYCGHIVPANLNKNLKFKISEISGKIISELGLVGSVGIDFVLRNNGNSFEIYFIEINPRFQDTLETVEKYRGVNLVEKHIQTLEGKLDKNLDISKCIAAERKYAGARREPPDMEINPRFQDTLETVEKYRGVNLVEKHIQTLDGKLDDIHSNCPEKYFAKGILFADKRTKVGNLNNISGIHDIPREGSIVQEAEPVCTVSSIGNDEVGVMKNLYSKIKLIKSELY